MRNNPLQKRFIFFLLILLVSSGLYCHKKSDWLKIEIGGEQHLYRRIEYKIKDLEKEPLNTRRIQTEHCMIQYSDEFEEYLATMIRASEHGYKKVAEDLKFDMNSRQPQISYLSEDEYGRLTREAKPKALGHYKGNEITINGEVFNLDAKHGGLTEAAAIHEITHFVLEQVTKHHANKNRTDKLQGEFKCFRLFDEALARHESLPVEDLLATLSCGFPNGNFLSFGEMVTGDFDDSFSKSIFEFWALIKFLEDKWGKNILLDIIHSLNRLTVQEAIVKHTKMPFDRFEEEWFRYMHEVVNEYKMNKPKGGNDYGKDAAES